MLVFGGITIRNCCHLISYPTWCIKTKKMLREHFVSQVNLPSQKVGIFCLETKKKTWHLKSCGIVSTFVSIFQKKTDFTTIDQGESASKLLACSSFKQENCERLLICLRFKHHPDRSLYIICSIYISMCMCVYVKYIYICIMWLCMKEYAYHSRLVNHLRTSEKCVNELKRKGL